MDKPLRNNLLRKMVASLRGLLVDSYFSVRFVGTMMLIIIHSAERGSFVHRQASICIKAVQMSLAQSLPQSRRLQRSTRATNAHLWTPECMRG